MTNVEKALQDLKNGKMVIVTDDESRENEGDLIVAAEFASPEIINFMATYAKGLICAPITKQRALKLGLSLMVPTNTSKFETAFTDSIDFIESTTGISAFERSKTVMALADDQFEANHFKKPGHIFPLIADDGGVLVRDGHTEAAIDLMKLAGLKPAAVICEIMDRDGTMMKGPNLDHFSQTHGLLKLTIQELIQYRKAHENLILDSEEIKLPTKFGNFKAKAYINKIDQTEHIALYPENFKPDSATTVRIHSECLTGDTFGSKRCDCGEQLEIALKELKDNPNSVLIYLKQEGRGIGLFNKVKAYKLQESGMDTASANEHLGFDRDLREYFFAAQILKDLKVQDVILLTNNPDKVYGLVNSGINIIKRISIKVNPNPDNEFYLKTKAKKFGHQFEDDLNAKL